MKSLLNLQQADNNSFTMSSLSETTSRAATTISDAISSMLRSSGILVPFVTGLTWDMDVSGSDGALCFSWVKLPAKDLERQIQAHIEALNERGWNIFKPFGGEREEIGKINHYTGQKNLELQLLEMVYLAKDQLRKLNHSPKDEELVREVRRVADEIVKVSSQGV